MASLMNLSLPTPSVTLGPAWAQQINDAFNRVDIHDHSTGFGAKVKPNGINVDRNLSFNGFGATNLGLTSFSLQSSELTGLTNAQSLWTYNTTGDLYWTNASGNKVQITSGNSIITPTSANVNVLNYLQVSTDTAIPSDSAVVVYGVSITDSLAKDVTLPSASIAKGRIFIIKDVRGVSEVYPINVKVQPGNSIDGNSESIVLNSNYGSVMVISDGSNSWLVV